MLFGSRATVPVSLLSRRMAHGSASLTVGEVGDGAAVTSGSGVRVATGLSQPAGGDDEALAGSSRGRAKGATTPVAVARSARFWSAMEGPPLMLAAPRPAGRDPGPAPPILHKYVWLRQPPGRGWGDRARRNHRDSSSFGGESERSREPDVLLHPPQCQPSGAEARIASRELWAAGTGPGLLPVLLSRGFVRGGRGRGIPCACRGAGWLREVVARRPWMAGGIGTDDVSPKCARLGRWPGRREPRGYQGIHGRSVQRVTPKRRGEPTLLSTWCGSVVWRSALTRSTSTSGPPPRSCPAA